jgi:hypothetical protein
MHRFGSEDGRSFPIEFDGRVGGNRVSLDELPRIVEICSAHQVLHPPPCPIHARSVLKRERGVRQTQTEDTHVVVYIRSAGRALSRGCTR